jgi:monoamine oxidase
MKLTRRQLGGFAGALPFTGASAAAAARDPDVVIVGAGAAGIAAAQTLINGGRSVQIIEASARTGGRCLTDTATFGAPFDRGAAWLRGIDRNPLTGLVKLHGFDLAEPDPSEMLFAGGKLQRRASNRAYERAFDALSEALSQAAEEETDFAAADAKPRALDDDAQAWIPTVATAVGPLDMGVDLKQMSVKDWFLRDDAEPNRMVAQGLGTLIARLAYGLPVAVNTRARRISVAGKQVRIETERGALNTRAAIVTPSIGVLASGAIAFDPPLEAGLQSALGGLQMGLLTKIALQFNQGSPTLAFPQNTLIVPQSPDDRGHCFLIKPLGAPLAVCLVGGSLAWDLSRQAQATNGDFARERLRALLGADADRGFRGGAATTWGTDPNTFGAFATALPGQWKARAALAAPIGGRVFLAGEALAGKHVQTVHGAYESGQRAARRVLNLLKT